MRKHISKGTRLLVISDTTMSLKDGVKEGFEPVVRELDSISDLFDEIIWLGYRRFTIKHAISAPISANIKLIPMPPSGGGGIFGLLKIFCCYPIYLFCILKNIKGVTHIHTRAPSHPALIAMFISKFDAERLYWHKYAGNWNDSNPPTSYGFQRDLLKRITNKKVYATINGKWPNQNGNIISFENPCLSESELLYATKIAENKEFGEKLRFLFVGNLSAFKGIVQLIEAIELVDFPDRILELIIAGDGDLLNELVKMSKITRRVPIRLLGAVKREELVHIYSISHINILPSSSEGFPKVIAEGAAFGCIPVVTNVSSIGQYIDDGKNGYLLNDNIVSTIKVKLNQIICDKHLKSISLSALKICRPFTYEFFNSRIENLFINK
jgi:glycosyltransferase involved in cell wall biosynthesis